MTRQSLNPVVITRPLAQAADLADRVAALGREAILFPLLDIRPLADPGPLRAALADLRRYAMVAFVSPNAIDAAFRELDRWPGDVALAVIGEGSRAALARHGVTSDNATIFSPRDPQRTDSQTLLGALDVAALRGRKVLILRGESGRELLADTLRNAGVDVEQVAAYRRLAPVLDETRQSLLLRLIETRNDWIITSSEALRILLQMVERLSGQDGVSKMQRQRMIVPHHRIEEAARSMGFDDITLTGGGDERLLAALQSRR